ncbi:MAG: indolepyruvate ferredoxin oxidoreductase family protein [Geminicoccaceae bacterium]
MAGDLTVTLGDKYELASGRIFLTGIQALVRLPLVQKERDRANGLNTAGLVTGYRGSPLGAYDQQLALATRYLAASDIIHQPAVNEDLAATACQGTQQVGHMREGRFDGVFAIWYGKGPGVDRSGDAFRHGNLFGSSRHGGVLLLLGDDHICESSTTAHQSEYAMVDALIPVLNPAGVQEILEFGLLGIAMSRFSGAWVSLKCIHDTVEATASIDVGPDLPAIRLPDEHEIEAGERNLDLDTRKPLPRVAVDLERRLKTVKMEAARAFARANAIDKVVMGDERAKLGVISCGKSYLDLVAALALLGIDEGQARRLGLRIYKVGMVFPLEPLMLETALRGLEKAMVIEEKRGLIESQAKELLYGGDVRPVIIGKEDEMGAPLFPSHGSLDANIIAVAIARRLLDLGEDAQLRRRLEAIEAAMSAHSGFTPAMVRLPWFCPGCPHNTSTRVPEGSQAMAGIGCHTMTIWMDRETFGFTQMGGEGASWCGEAPFSKTGHIFQNVGDGTFFHSGSLAIRAAIASGQNITYKLLYNDAVAMTGGQKMETGNLSVPQICRMLAAEGVAETVVVTDDVGKYPIAAGFPHGVRVRHRDDLMEVQKRLRRIAGVTVIIYDQTCAAEKRRRRKRGRLADPDERIFINDLVCEGCGDCGVQSNCVAIQPLETDFGRKRRIDQSACNKDYSCIKGFCPSFVSVHGGKLRKPARQEVSALGALPVPTLPGLTATMGILVVGIGGTGVVTIAALLGMAAHIEGKGVAGLDMIGLAQKGGAVVSHLKLAPDPAGTGSPRLTHGGADLVIAADLVVAAGPTAIPLMRHGRTRIVLNTEQTTTGHFIHNPDLEFPAQRLEKDIEGAVGKLAMHPLDATRLAERLLGDAIAANALLLGHAWQLGLLPLQRESILHAIKLNNVAVDLNREAFEWGRYAAHDPDAVARYAGLETQACEQTLDDMIAQRASFLLAYQDRAYAERYCNRVAAVRHAERSVDDSSEVLSRTVARCLFKLMAVKDEYEVARLYTDGSFQRQLSAQFESYERLELHLAPPLLASRDPATGHLLKKRYGPWIFRVLPLLAHMRRWRGSWFDIFSRTAERRRERALMAGYEVLLDRLMRELTSRNLAAAIALAGVPEQIRGFGHVKERHIERAKKREADLLRAFDEANRPAPYRCSQSLQS